MREIRLMACSPNLLSYDNLRVVNMRSAPPEPSRDASPATRLLPWLVLAVAIAAGVVLAFRYGVRITPFIDGIR